MSKDFSITGFTVDELDENVKKKMLDNYRDLFTDYDTHHLTEDLREVLREDGLVVDSLYWSLSHSQGDGVAFAVEKIDLDFLGRNQPDFEKYITEFEKLGLDLSVEIVQSGRYFHSDSMSLMVNYDEEKRQSTEIQKKISKFLHKLLSFVRKESSKLEQIGYEYIDYYTSDECIEEHLRLNNFYFTKQGELIPDTNG